MSNTRKRPTGEAPAQQGYSSSAEYERGLLANLVALRCDVIGAPEDRELLFALQHASHHSGGLAKLAEVLIADYPDHLATRSMQRIGVKAGQIYNAKQVREIREEMPGGCDEFLLRGEFSGHDELCWPEQVPVRGYKDVQRNAENRRRVAELETEAALHPVSYPSERFVNRCRYVASENLTAFLERLCVDPAQAVQGPWYFPDLILALRHHFDKSAEAVGRRLAETTITRQVFEALDYCLTGDGITLIEGLARTGKTYAIKAWCDQRPGLARYVQVPPTNDEISFFRRIAEALGVSSSLSLKSTQLRERVERTARAAKLAIVFDESHYLLSQDYRCRKRPTRIAWVMNELINYGVPVAICTTPQFIQDKARIHDRTGWAWEQFDGRIGHMASLEQILSMEDLKAIARVHLPAANSDTINGVALYAQTSSSYVAGIEHVAKRAFYIARKAGRNAVSTADVVSAIKARSSLDLNSAALKAHREPSRERSVSLGRLSSPVRSASAESGLALAQPQ